MINGLPAHSPLGASGATRWMNCPGSVSLSAGCEDEESDFAKEGTIAHALAALCLETGDDAWQHVGSNASLFEGWDVDVEMADAVQIYLNAIRDWHEDRNQGNFWIERQFHCPNLHEYFYGTADAVYLDEHNGELHVWDYKHGAGIVVEVQRNAQTMYYACGALTDLQMWNAVDKITLHIAQPRGFHFAGPIRSWSISTDDLDEWLGDELLPAMDLALVSRDTASGDHCRFCPVRSYACPQIDEDMNELEKMMTLINEKGGAAELTNEQVGRYLELFSVAKIAAKAAEKTAYARMMGGNKVPGQKLVTGRKNRVWKKGATAALKKALGQKAYKTELRSPTQVEELVGGKKLTERWAAKPKGDLTVAPLSDSRTAVNVDTKSMFKDQTKTGEK
jgi:hypothetical protein